MLDQEGNASSPVTGRPVSSSPVAAASDVLGGIDFNADQFNIKTKGAGIDMNVPFDESMLKDFNPDTISPIIIQIVPIPNPQLLLGLTDEPQAQPNTS